MGTDNILDLQNNGYKNSVYAIAEIIDNSIQAEAKKIDVVIINDTTISSSISEILIIDDGNGMNQKDFSKALMMNSGTRGGAKQGLGKYGQGLPNSSISQTKRVEVYTSKDNITLYNYIDLDEIFESQEPFLPEIEIVDNINIPLLKNVKLEVSKNGTIVRWVKPNKISPKTTRLLIENTEKLISRIFRYYLNGFEEEGELIKTEINILVYDFNGSQYGLNTALSRLKVLPFDPMFLMEKTIMNFEFKKHLHPTNKLHAKASKKFIIETVNDKNEIEDHEAEIEILFSYVKPKERFRDGGGGGKADKNFREIYKKRKIKGSRGYDNISIVRANREIDCGDYGFLPEGLKEIYRWWSVEIRTNADVDSIIGIDNKKQQASNIKSLDGNDDHDDHEILKFISETISGNIDSMMKEISEQWGKYIPEPNPKVSKPGSPDLPPTPPLGPTEPDDEPNPDEITTDKDRKELYDWVKERYENLKDEEIWSRVDWAFSISDTYIFVYSNLGDTVLYDYQVYGTKVLVEINLNHSFYKQFIAQLESENTSPFDNKKIRSIRLLICSFVKAELSNKTDDKNINRYLRKYKNSIAISLDEYIDDLFSN
ncbi:ATP-binding protein [uncultured Polaribacter sp.]|uniref:ATP-binding protein n=1 Tax=uncultured Polaribacter sp. TaxID=174711 RepID=UPI00261C59F7|nr:ATP-binding protein [uncultured Polaribacter sp.]